jgi:sulfite oxidase
MNGAPLQPEHGAPVRVVVPGYIGARSVKWLTTIRVEATPSTNHYHAAYSVTSGEPGAIPRVLGEAPVNSAIAMPASGATVAPGPCTIRGWAVGAHDAVVERVEVSADGGATWTDAAFSSPATPFAWRLWEARLPLIAGTHTLVSRATDSLGNTQPSDAESLWNVKGYVNNSWHRVRIQTH